MNTSRNDTAKAQVLEAVKAGSEIFPTDLLKLTKDLSYDEIQAALIALLLDHKILLRSDRKLKIVA